MNTSKGTVPYPHLHPTNNNKAHLPRGIYSCPNLLLKGLEERRKILHNIKNLCIKCLRLTENDYSCEEKSNNTYYCIHCNCHNALGTCRTCISKTERQVTKYNGLYKDGCESRKLQPNKYSQNNRVLSASIKSMKTIGENFVTCDMSTNYNINKLIQTQKRIRNLSEDPENKHINLVGELNNMKKLHQKLLIESKKQQVKSNQIHEELTLPSVPAEDPGEL